MVLANQPGGQKLAGGASLSDDMTNIDLDDDRLHEECGVLASGGIPTRRH